MLRMKTRRSLRIFTAFLVLCFAIPVAAQTDPDPNSPTPVLVRAPGKKRVLAVSAEGGRVNLTSPPLDSFPPNSKIAVFVQNVELMEDEGANAFRIYAEDARGQSYRFPVVDLYQVKASVKTYALIFELRDDIGYWDAPQAGDVLIRTSWRGMTSNRHRLGYEQTGGTLQDDVIPFSERVTFQQPAEPAPRVSRVKGGVAEHPAAVGYRWSGDRFRFLEQSSFGPNTATDQRLRRLGLRIWLAEQFEAPYPSAANPYPNNPLKPSNAPADCDSDQTVTPDVPVTCFRDTYSMYPVQSWFFKEAYYGDAQLRHRVAWALGQIWVISGVDTQQSRHMTEYHKILSANAFGNYRTLMQQMTLNPGMGNYLDMVRSTRTNPNENYAREVLQLFSIGLFKLNQDGSVQCIEHNPCQAGDTPDPTYDQDVVNNFTKVTTGWGFCNQAASCPNIAAGTVNYIDPMLVNAGITTPGTNGANSRHDLTAKTLLSYPGSNSTNIAACTGTCDDTIGSINTYATNSLNQALDNIFFHPTLGPYVSKVMIQHMVTSDPSPAYISRVAAKFNNNGAGVRGDMKAVVAAILLDPEARGDVKTDPNFGKLREPVQLITNLGRTFDVTNAAQTGQSDGVFWVSSATNGQLTPLAQVPFYSPTVFNYFPPDYQIPGTTLLGPEFVLMTTSTAVGRTNFVTTFTIGNGIAVNGVNVPVGTRLNVTELQALAAADTTGQQLVDHLNRKMLYGTMSTQMRTTILTAVTAIAASNPITAQQALDRAKQALFLVASSSQYQVQR